MRKQISDLATLLLYIGQSRISPLNRLDGACRITPYDIGKRIRLDRGRIRLSGTSQELDRNPEVRRAYLGIA